MCWGDRHFKSFTYKVIPLWNQLPGWSTQSPNLHEFHKNLRPGKTTWTFASTSVRFCWTAMMKPSSLPPPPFQPGWNMVKRRSVNVDGVMQQFVPPPPPFNRVETKFSRCWCDATVCSPPFQPGWNMLKRRSVNVDEVMQQFVSPPPSPLQPGWNEVQSMLMWCNRLLPPPPFNQVETCWNDVQSMLMRWCNRLPLPPLPPNSQQSSTIFWNWGLHCSCKCD